MCKCLMRQSILQYKLDILWWESWLKLDKCETQSGLFRLRYCILKLHFQGFPFYFRVSNPLRARIGYLPVSKQMSNLLMYMFRCLESISNSIEQTPWEANSLSTGHEISRLLRTRRFIVVPTRNRLFSILSQFNPVYNLTFSLTSVLILSTHLRIHLPNSLFFYVLIKILFVSRLHHAC